MAAALSARPAGCAIPPHLSTERSAKAALYPGRVQAHLLSSSALMFASLRCCSSSCVGCSSSSSSSSSSAPLPLAVAASAPSSSTSSAARKLVAQLSLCNTALLAAGRVSAAPRSQMVSHLPPPRHVLPAPHPRCPVAPLRYPCCPWYWLRQAACRRRTRMRTRQAVPEQIVRQGVLCCAQQGLAYGVMYMWLRSCYEETQASNVYSVTANFHATASPSTCAPCCLTPPFPLRQPRDCPTVYTMEIAGGSLRCNSSIRACLKQPIS